ncbi:glycoside hydrolase family 61 protein [Tothia fuscella]|uniref:AA9 family lytic polysaccharide monooxygenase n=1 Tax=Tothia fuscella TaxID=1048955 RepID=A0A9P4NNF1_9PEZI|nr:glycoside hydrolase family 61 protein [Tothia fuscella]
MLSLSLFVFASAVSAHAVWQDLWVNGKDQSSTCVRMPKNNSPMSNVNSPDMRCNVGGAKGVPGVCDISAGDKLTVEMHQQLGDRKCANEAIGGRHFGPVMIYMCAVPDAKESNGDCSWVKVAEDTYAGTEASWGTEKMNKNCGKTNFTVPKSLKAGNYLVRAEALALHTAGGNNGAQFYMSCYQVNVAKGGSTPLPAGVKIPGAYSPKDPGILVNIYQPNIKYVAPGPKVWSGA